MKKKFKPYINIQEYIDRCNFRRNAPLKCDKGECTIFDGNKWLPINEFNSLYPEAMLLHKNIKGGNPDRTKNWLKSEKSY